MQFCQGREEEYNAILLRDWNDNNHNHDSERRALMVEMKAIEERVSYARDLILSKQLDPADFKQIKADCAQQLEKLDAKLADLPDELVNIELLLKTDITALSRLTADYKQASPERKRQIISSIYPEKLSFDGSAVRTTRVNDIAASIYMMNKKLQAIKKPDKTRFTILSGQVGATGLLA